MTHRLSLLDPLRITRLKFPRHSRHKLIDSKIRDILAQADSLTGSEL